MNDDLLDDLKQFVAATISQATAQLVTKSDIASLQDRIDQMDTKLDEVQAAIAEALTTSNDSVDEQLIDHDQRISKLEHRTAS